MRANLKSSFVKKVSAGFRVGVLYQSRDCIVGGDNGA